MNLLARKQWLGFTFFLLMLSAAGLFGGVYWVQKDHHHKPIAAFYTLASTMEHGNKAELSGLTSRDVLAELNELAEPYGGVQELGKLLKETPEVSSRIHVPFTSIEVVARVEHKHLLMMFARRQGHYIATTAFFVD